MEVMESSFPFACQLYVNILYRSKLFHLNHFHVNILNLVKKVHVLNSQTIDENAKGSRIWIDL
jgi:hypothetical protein